MTLIIEDGSIVTGANSYITVAEYNTWADARFGAGRATAPADDTAAEQLILRAMDYFETKAFKGIKSQESQPLQWPRDGVIVDNYYVDSDEIPKEVKFSIYELAYAEESGNGQFNVVDRKVTREKVDVIEIEYSATSGSRNTVVAASATMRKLLKGGGGFGVVHI